VALLALLLSSASVLLQHLLMLLVSVSMVNAINTVTLVVSNQQHAQYKGRIARRSSYARQAAVIKSLQYQFNVLKVQQADAKPLLLQQSTTVVFE
jgi:uncharacterized protein (DUF2384 family)